MRIGLNSRLDTIQAAILLEKIKFFDEEIKECNQVAEEYNKGLQGVVKVPVVKEGFVSNWAQYTICFQNNEKREQAIKKLKENGILTAVYYRKPMHMQQAFKDKMVVELKYIVTEKVCERCLSLPMHPYLDINSIRKIVECILKI